MDKVLGIIGGMGPLATVKLFEKIVLLTDANSDQEHLHILVDNNTKIPDRTNFLLSGTGENPKIKLIESARRLESMGADYIVMPCNTAHHFYKEILDEINIPFINMIEETGRYLEANHINQVKIGLLATEGTVKTKIYENVLQNYNIEIITPSNEKQRYISNLINGIKEGRNEENLDGFYSAVEEVKKQGVELFIIGCTELSVALELYELDGNYIDALKILAIRAIEYSGRGIK